tara:strand:+ start:227 stop:1039 length:813 start_codon:yes stop_codon:yes gene_type:complete
MAEIIEKVKAYWNKRPCNINHSKKEFCSLEYFEEVRNKKYFVEPHILDFAEHHLYKDKNILEIGCGIGTDSIEFAKNGANLDVIDISKESLDICKKRFEVYGLKANFYRGNAENLSEIIPDKKYDLIYAFGSIHHSPNPEKIVQHVYNFLKPNGEFKIMVYYKYSFKMLNILHNTNWDFSVLNDLIPEFSEAQRFSPITYGYTEDSLKKLLHKFQINKMYKDHIFSYKIPQYLKNEYVREDWCKKMSAEQFKELESELGWHYLVKTTKNN